MSNEEGVWYLDKNGKAWYLNKNGKAVPMTTNNSGGNDMKLINNLIGALIATFVLTFIFINYPITAFAILCWCSAISYYELKDK